MNILNDLSYSFRLLGKTPAFSAICLIVIALGATIALSTFSLLYELKYKALPFVDGDRFVVLKSRATNSGFGAGPLIVNSYAFNTIKATANGLDEIGGYEERTVAISDGEMTIPVSGVAITPNLLHCTGVQPFLGRLLNNEDTISGAAPVVLISFREWQNYYNADPNIIGTMSRIDGMLRTIVGVMPEGFGYPVAHNVWLPLDIPDTGRIEDNFQNIWVAGFLAEGANFSSVNSEIDTALARLAQELPSKYTNVSADISYHASVFIEDGGMGNALLVITVVVLFLVCLNLGTLLFVRANARRQELSIRNALGASRFQILVQILLESLLLCIAGILIALGLSHWLLTTIENGISSLMAGSQVDALPFWFNLDIDSNGLTVAIGLLLVIWLASGSVTALRASGKGLNQNLDSGTKGASDSKIGRATRAVVGIEIVLSCFLLIVCGLVAVTTYNMQETEFGGTSENLAIAFLNLTGENYSDDQNRLQFLRDLELELVSSELIEDATFTTAIPGRNPTFSTSFALEDRDVQLNQQYPSQGVVWVENDYFEILDIGLQAGRSFSQSDTSNSLPVVIIDQIFANNFWLGESAIGKRIQISPDRAETSEWLTVVGVIPPILQGDPILNQQNLSTFYRSAAQKTPNRFRLVAKYVAGAAVADVRQQIVSAGSRIDRDVPLDSIKQLIESQRTGIGVQAAAGRAFAGIAIATFILAIIGIYAVIVRSIDQRTMEIGIRRAMGSSADSIVWIFLKQGLLFLTIGVVVGGGGAILASNALTIMYADLLNWLVPVFLVVTGSIGTMILLASYLPARRAIQLEPGDALRYE